MSNNKGTLVTAFCTPPVFPVSAFENRVLETAQRFDHQFEGITIPVYAWGEGKNILFAHGWGSRASHGTFIAHTLSKSGFRVTAYDAPAHGSAGSSLNRSTSNMFEFCRTLSSVFTAFGPFEAVIGHSLGALCACFTLAGYMEMAPYKIDCKKLVMISSPLSVKQVVDLFCREHHLERYECETLAAGLETDFDFSIDDYTVNNALEYISSETLIIHDTDDEKIPGYDLQTTYERFSNIKVLETSGYGHEKILGNRAMMKRILEHCEDGQQI